MFVVCLFCSTKRILDQGFNDTTNCRVLKMIGYSNSIRVLMVLLEVVLRLGLVGGGGGGRAGRVRCGGGRAGRARCGGGGGVVEVD